MFHTTIRVTGRLLSAVTLTVAVAACAGDTPSAPSFSNAAAIAGSQSREVDLGSCTNLAVPAGNKVSARLFAAGTQNYMWNNTTWYFVGPTADLSADAGGNSLLGIHYAGPTWVSNSGSGVVGRLVDKCTVDANSIPWLLLSAVSSRGPGIFEGTTFIQRINTVGGNAPTTPGAAYGEMARVPYTAEYVFYQAQ